MSTNSTSNLAEQAPKWRDAGFAAQMAKAERKKMPMVSMESLYKMIWDLEAVVEKKLKKAAPPRDPIAIKVEQITRKYIVNGAVAPIPAVSRKAAPKIEVLDGLHDSSSVHFDSIDFKIMIKPGHVIDIERLKLLSGLLVEEQILGEKVLSDLISEAEKVIGPGTIPWLPSLYRAGLRAAFRDATEAIILKHDWQEFEVYVDHDGCIAGMSRTSAMILREFFEVTNNPNVAEMTLLHQMTVMDDENCLVERYRRHRDIKMLPAYIMWNVSLETLLDAESMIQEGRI